MGLKVMEKACENCLFSNQAIVDAERKKEVLQQCLTENRYFICHKPELLKMQGRKVPVTDICCREFYDRLGHHVQLIRIAQRVDAVEFVPEEKLYHDKP